MNSFTSNDAKQEIGKVIELAPQEPATIIRKVRPSVGLSSDADCHEQMAWKYGQLKEEVVRGFDSLGPGVPAYSVDEVATKVLTRNSE